MASFTDYNTNDSSLSGTIDGLNTIFTMPLTPSFVEVYVDQLQQCGSGVNYTWTGNTITFKVPPPLGSLVTVWAYRQ